MRTQHIRAMGNPLRAVFSKAIGSLASGSHRHGSLRRGPTRAFCRSPPAIALTTRRSCLAMAPPAAAPMCAPRPSGPFRPLNPQPDRRTSLAALKPSAMGHTRAWPRACVLNNLGALNGMTWHDSATSAEAPASTHLRQRGRGAPATLQSSSCAAMPQPFGSLSRTLASPHNALRARSGAASRAQPQPPRVRRAT